MNENNKVTLQDIEANIVSEHYFTVEEGAQGRFAKVNPDLGMGYALKQKLHEAEK